jgi:surfeit locus 1 family protein
MKPAARYALYTTPLITAYLGYWQKERLAWKEDMLERVAAAQAAEPWKWPSASVYTDEELLRLLHAIPYRRITGHGSLVAPDDPGLFVGPRVRGGASGYLQLVPFRMSSDGSVILLNRGWVPTDVVTAVRQGESPDLLDRRSDDFAVVGSLRPAESPSSFTPANNATTNKWFSVDPPTMAASTGPDVLPIILDVIDESPPSPSPYPIGRQVVGTNIKNDHRQYMYTWWSLTACLIAACAVVRRRGPL